MLPTMELGNAHSAAWTAARMYCSYPEVVAVWIICKIIVGFSSVYVAEVYNLIVWCIYSICI